MINYNQIKFYLPEGAVKQVANEFGVSNSLVSQVLNGTRVRKDDNILKRLIQLGIENKKNKIRIQESIESLMSKLEE